MKIINLIMYDRKKLTRAGIDFTTPSLLTVIFKSSIQILSGF